jgi:predicted dehydrogenase
MASVGIDGKGLSDSTDAGNQGDMVAICDVDSARLAKSAQKHPKAKPYTDFRKMLEEMQGSIDAVTVSTPDHTHAPAALMAMRMGKHCFCQKPLTRTIYEARLMGTVAREMKVATQMGNQGTADSSLRREAAWLRAGVLGDVTEVHVWTNRPIWPQGIPRPEPSACPESLDWNLWLGAAPERPYADGYHPFKWRGWWDFGTGALGDMACHNINMPFMGLDLRNPIWVEAETSGHNHDSFPSWSIVTFQFAATDSRPALKLFWYEGGKIPAADLLEGQQVGTSGSLAIGTKGKLLNGRLLGGAEPVEVKYPESPGHFEEWVRAIRGGEPAMSNFPDYAGPLTETVLLGNLAIWTGQRVEWDAAKMAAKNVTGVETLIKPVYRDGYTLEV